MRTHAGIQPASRARSATIALLSAGALAFAAPPLASAQQQAQPQTVSSAEVADEELKAFAKCNLDIIEIQQTVQEQLAAVQDPDEATRLQQQANQEMVAVVTNRGVDVARYNSISHSLGADPDLERRFVEIRDEVLEERQADE